ncbi:hypothetical protein D9M70_643020 [compost metagenome]
MRLETKITVYGKLSVIDSSVCQLQTSRRVDPLAVPWQFCLSEAKVPVFVRSVKHHRITDDVEVLSFFDFAHIARSERKLDGI